MLWHIIIASIGGRPGRREPQSGKEGYWKRGSVFDTPRLDLGRTRVTGRPVS